MAHENTTPLGYIDLADGRKAIFPMNDIFLNYTFESPEYWEALHTAANMVIDAFILENPDTSAKLIEAIAKVRTQFRHLLGIDNTTRDQDIKLEDIVDKFTYMEFQIRAMTDPPVEIRSVEYFGLGIGHSKGKTANQIWLLAQDVDSVLFGEVFTRYVLKDEVTGNAHPSTSGIMYVSLTKLSRAEGPAGELASFLLGKNPNPWDKDVKKIAEAFKSSFESFKNDKDVVKVMTLAERYKGEGLAEGLAEGRAEGLTEGEAKGMNKAADQMLALIKSGIDPEEALNMIKNNAAGLATG